jgi:pimeloyl-ACP methyl ester carboxylesterase
MVLQRRIVHASTALEVHPRGIVLPLISRREALAPLSVALVVPALPSDAHNQRSTPLVLPDRYDDPLGIGLEGWPYPAPVRWHACTAGGQLVRMAFMDVAPTGKSRNKVVVLLHGKNFDSSYWAGPIKDLSEAGFRVIVPDQIGFNKSSKPDIEYSFEMLAELTINLLSGLQIAQATFIGHSTGGMLAVRIATAFPDHVDRLVLEDPIGLVDYRRFIPPQSTETLIEEERRRTISNYRTFMRGFFATLPPQAIEHFVEWRMRVAQSSEYERFCRATARTYQMIYREPVRDQFPDIRATTLLIVGEKDKAAPLKRYAVPEMAAKMPSIPEAAPLAVKDLRAGSLVIVPDVGHVPHLEAPDQFRAAILSFLLS